jgi:HD superfamily phosphohydrolase
MTNKRKIINDPVHGFLNIPTELLYDLVQHPHFQRLRRIKQLGLAEFVYPGATHTRFHHALGAMHLMGLTLHTLRQKGIEISPEELEGAQIAILLHDIGHGPMSHALEYSLLQNVHHEELSMLIMEKLNQEFNGQLSLAIEIFKDLYPRRFFHQLVSSQLDMDRMDYLQRDSFFTGVHEGTIGADRIIKMLAVVQDLLVVEEKAIYSLENFLTTRRLMYWQVYLHKTNVAGEKMLVSVLKRAREILAQGKDLHVSSPCLKTLLSQNIGIEHFTQPQAIDYLQLFTQLDDYDIWASLKSWATGEDYILSVLSKGLLNRQLFKVNISTEKPSEENKQRISKHIIESLNLKAKHLPYFFVEGTIRNEAYWKKGESISVLMKNGEVLDLAQASDLPAIKALRKVVKKHYWAYWR